MADVLEAENDPGSPRDVGIPELFDEAFGLLLTQLILTLGLVLLLAKQKGLSNNSVLLGVIANQDKRSRIRALVFRRFIVVNTSDTAWILKVASFFVKKFHSLSLLLRSVEQS